MEQSTKKRKVRQLTKNEKVLLILLAIVLVVWLAFKFIYSPQIEKLAELELEKQDYQMKIEDINTSLRNEKNINKEWQELKMEKDNIVADYFPTLDQAQIIYLLNELIRNDEVSIQDMSFSRPVMTDLNDFQVNNMDISIPYSGSYSGIIDILDSIKKSPRKISVSNLSMDSRAEGGLSGNLGLRIYSLDGITESDANVIYIDTTASKEKNNPFSGYEKYQEQIAEDDEYKDEISESNSADDIFAEPINPYIEETLLDFEINNSYFIPSQELVKGNVSLSTKAKSKKHSLKLEYNIVAVKEQNIAFVDVTRNNIMLKYPPNTIGMWVYSYDYSPVTLGVAFKDQMGQDILVPLTEGIGWTGWKYVEASPPYEMNVYPMRLQSIYLEMPDNREDFGILLIDKLEAIYNRNLGEDGSDLSLSNHIFHIVKRGDSIESISELYYGNKKYKDEIIKLNEINPNEILEAGRVLVLKKRYQLPFVYPDKYEEKLTPVEDKNEEPKTIEHIVERGDNLSKISQLYYGSAEYVTEIMELNDIQAGAILPVGKVLVLKKR